ncbi:hypothetical protein [Sphingomonas sp. M1-B02]|uniref:hypothetical protein n=1 Tax=Sphingomonas sp. M1-B02 TaxID=3114300 RepID=UPI0022403804|nr:hypothetical protein [Sphingomonas sp. S6-11]UZK65362.1 hypothetical protein OKW87_12690 [Sphingomonas sp. S6-11]
MSKLLVATIAALTSITAPSIAAGQDVAPQSAPPARPAPLPPGPPPGPPLPDMPGTGPYPAFKQEVASLPNHVVYQPRNLAALKGRRMPVYVFGNGGCSSDGASARLHLLEIASHGYLAVALGTIKSGPGVARGGPPGANLDQTTTQQMIDAIDWAVAENGRSGSPLRNRLDLGKIAVSGHSCGGLQAIDASRDPRVTTTIVMNSGVYNPGREGRSSVKIGKERLLDLKGSALYVLGGPTDIAYPNGMDDFRRITHIPVVVANLPVGHGGTFGTPHGGQGAALVVKWLDFRLKGDRAAGRWFDGSCPECTPGWTIEHRGGS